MQDACAIRTAIGTPIETTAGTAIVTTIGTTIVPDQATSHHQHNDGPPGQQPSTGTTTSHRDNDALPGQQTPYRDNDYSLCLTGTTGHRGTRDH